MKEPRTTTTHRALRAKEFGEQQLRYEASGNSGFVLGKAAALVVEADDLALQFAHRPISPDAIDFIEATLGFVGELNAFGKMRVGQAKNPFGMG